MFDGACIVLIVIIVHCVHCVLRAARIPSTALSALCVVRVVCIMHGPFVAGWLMAAFWLGLRVVCVRLTAKRAVRCVLHDV